MRPVNLIPPEDRRGDRAPLRAGRLSYVLVGALTAVLGAITLIVLTGNQVTDRKAELANLERAEAEASARAEQLRPYAEFASLTESRVATVTSLAQSRFDWERVLRELALVMPDDVWLTSLSAASAGGEGSEGAEGVVGPSLTMAGCGDGHEAVARFLQALRDIDGVTRVGLGGSSLSQEGDGGGAGDAASSGGCQTRDFIAGFEVSVAFDGVPVATSSTIPPATAAVPPADADASTPPETADARDSVGEQSDKAQNAANLIPGVAR